MAADCCSCPVGSCSTAVTGVRLCQLGPLLLCRRELVSLPSLSVPLSNFRGLPVTRSDQLWNITAELRGSEHFKEYWLLCVFREPSHKFLAREIGWSFSVLCPSKMCNLLMNVTITGKKKKGEIAKIMNFNKFQENKWLFRGLSPILFLPLREGPEQKNMCCVWQWPTNHCVQRCNIPSLIHQDSQREPERIWYPYEWRKMNCQGKKPTNQNFIKSALM